MNLKALDAWWIEALMNNELVLSPWGSTPVFIVRWDARASQDQTDLTKGRDASAEAVEEASRIGGPKP